MNPIRPYQHHQPTIHNSCYIDAASVIIGEAILAENVSVWPFAVIRADVNFIEIGKDTNIQDHCMLHVSHKTTNKPQGSPLIIGTEVTIGHHATLHGCKIGNRVLIGINSIILDDVVIEDEVIIGAGSLVPPRKHLESGFLYMGSPAAAIRPLSLEERHFLSYSAQHYVQLSRQYTTISTQNNS